MSFVRATPLFPRRHVFREWGSMGTILHFDLADSANIEKTAWCVYIN